MTDDPKKKFRKASEAIDLNLGGLLGNLGEVLGEAVQRLTEAGEAAVDKMSQVETERGPLRSHAGVRIRVGGLDAKAKPKSAGPQPVNPGRAKPAEPPARALDCELIEDGAGWILTAEMPGVAANEVALAIEGARLTISSTGARRFLGAVDLPLPCAAEDISINLVNGILTLRSGAA